MLGTTSKIEKTIRGKLKVYTEADTKYNILLVKKQAENNITNKVVSVLVFFFFLLFAWTFDIKRNNNIPSTINARAIIRVIAPITKR